MTRTRFTQMLDGSFLGENAPRSNDLKMVIKEYKLYGKQLVDVGFSEKLQDLLLLPSEARQIAESLTQMADLIDPEDEE